MALPPESGTGDARPLAESGANDASSVPESGVRDATPPAPDAGNGAIADLRADNNRDGIVDLNDPADDANEDTWDATHGAIFLANIDDDSLRCPKTGTDVDLAACNDAADEVVNGSDDALDLAPLAVRAWPTAPDGATGSLSVNAAAQTMVRLFLVNGGTHTVFHPTTDKLTAAQLRTGVNLAMEGKDIVRDTSKWDGYVDLTLTVSAPGGVSASDVVRLRVAPVITQHHLLPVDNLYAAQIANDPGSPVFLTDLRAATTAAGATLTTPTMDDQWMQDLFEAGYASRPAKGGAQTMRVVLRSANVETPTSTKSPLRAGGKIVFTALRGKDVAGVIQYDINHSPDMDTLDSFGNLETIPPYTFNGQSFPFGRVFRGSIATYHPDATMARLIEAQKVQPPVYVDTSWLLVGHVDETISFVKAPNARGWAMLANDPTLAKTMLSDQVTQGNGGVKMFVGLQSTNAQGRASSAEITIQGVLNDPDLMATSAEAAIHVSDQVAILKQATGLQDSDIVRVPYLHTAVSGASIAYQPGTVNGISLSDKVWAAPSPHGPTIAGKDIMKTQLETALGQLGITVRWVEDWSLYHDLEGEIHCGSNALRKIPVDLKWWESGR